MNNKTKSRRRKGRWKGRKPNEKAIQLRRYVRHWLRTNSLRLSAISQCVATATVFRNFRDSADSWLANPQSKKRLEVIR